MTLDQLLNEIETQELEFKEKPNPALFMTLSAFANTNGGVVFIGVSDKKEITGYRCSNADLKEFSETIVNKLAIHPVIEPTLFVRLANSAGRLPAADEHEPVAAILTRLGLMNGDQLTNGAFLLFGKKQDKYQSDAVLRIGRFKDGAVIIGDRWIDGNLFH